VVAYSGEIDGQRQAAELMTRAMADEGLSLVHIIGPNTGHRFEPGAKEEVAKRIDALAARGRETQPRKVRFTTWTLRYNQMAWVTVDALEQHWNRARVEAEVLPGNKIELGTTNVAALSLSMPANQHLLDSAHETKIILDGEELIGPPVSADGWRAHVEKKNSKWRLAKPALNQALRKRHGLQGPIDDAFMDAFIFVRPTGQPLNATTGTWISEAMAQAIKEWRLQFRGEPKVVDDVSIRQEDIAANNLVLWGDPQSNHLLARMAHKLPIKWDIAGVHLDGKIFTKHVPTLIYPNPLNPSHYVVLNSGFTFADAAPTSNALQIPELPDYALFDLDARQVVEGGFFDENWKLSR
jgi:hypothetical protein